jgi:hypothetical protein
MLIGTLPPLIPTVVATEPPARGTLGAEDVYIDTGSVFTSLPAPNAFPATGVPTVAAASLAFNVKVETAA